MFINHGDFKINRNLIEIIIQLSYAVRIPIFWLVELYHMGLGCEEKNHLIIVV